MRRKMWLITACVLGGLMVVAVVSGLGGATQVTAAPNAEARVLISAVLYDGYQSSDRDEAVQLVNVGTAPVDLAGWRVCDEGSGGTCVVLPSVVLSAGHRVWLAYHATDFYTSFGFLPDLARYPVAGVIGLSAWPGFANGNSPNQDEVVLRDAGDVVTDTLVYETGATTTPGWSGPAVEPYGVGRAEGQILYRIPDEATGLPVADTDTAADWIQYTGNVTYGRRVMYPGWDFDPLFWPMTATEPATVVVGIAPDNAFDVVSQTIARAQHAISIEVYSLRHPEIITALVQKAQEGVSVTVLLEGQQALVGVDDERWQQELWACQEIEAAGGQCFFLIHDTDKDIFNRYDYLHAKFIVVDGEWVLITSQNLTISGFPSDDKSNGTYGSRGVVLATDAPSVVARASQVFALDMDPEHHNDLVRWNTAGYSDKYGPPSVTYTPQITVSDYTTSSVGFSTTFAVSGTFDFELFTAPEAALRRSDALLGLVARAGAGDEVYVEQMYEYVDWGDNPADDPNLRLEAYTAAARRGAKVRILLNKGTFGHPYASTPNTATVAYVNQLARDEGLDLEAALCDPTFYGIHNKMVLVWLHGEGGYVHVGSINGSEGSSKVNRELALQVRSDEVYDYLARVFEADWRWAHPVFLPLVMANYTPPVDYVVVSEVMYRPSGQSSGNREWVELYNPTGRAIDISGWYLGDAAGQEYGAGRYRFPGGTVLPAHGVIVVAQQAEDFQGVSGFSKPHFEFLIDPYRNDSTVADMIADGSWDGFGFALGDAGDKVILRDAGGQDVDVVVYGAAGYGGVIAHPGGVESDWSLERRPPDYDTDDCSVDFVPRYPATPGSVPE
jgi:phosphatidylserine/phosphatidylglycerophosphate/cardiolipin synthase-like enzyme